MSRVLGVGCGDEETDEFTWEEGHNRPAFSRIFTHAENEFAK